MKAAQLLKGVAEQHLKTESTPTPGINGPYSDPETPVRNAAHWSITLFNLWQLTGEEKFRKGAEDWVELMLSNEYRPNNVIFHHREKQGKDPTNGLIGQAWTLEALNKAAEKLGRKELNQLAINLIKAHPFDNRKGLWQRVDLSGKALGFDMAFNHQLWFAASLAPFKEIDGAVGKQVETFLHRVPKNMGQYKSGLIFHLIERNLGFKAHLYKALIKRAGNFNPFLPPSIGKKYASLQNQMHWKAIGYHAFNLYAFGMLKKHYPDHPVWNVFQIQNALDYLCSSSYREDIQKEETYGFPYNPPGFEVPLVLHAFDIFPREELIEEASWWLNQQIAMHFDKDTFSFGRNTNDPATLNARIYELSRWPDVLLENVNVEV